MKKIIISLILLSLLAIGVYSQGVQNVNVINPIALKPGVTIYVTNAGSQTVMAIQSGDWYIVKSSNWITGGSLDGIRTPISVISSTGVFTKNFGYFGKVSDGKAGLITGTTSFVLTVYDQPTYWSFYVMDTANPNYIGILTNSFFSGISTFPLQQGVPLGFPVDSTVTLPAIFTGTYLSPSATYYYGIPTIK